jgi:hypothetical protein
MKKLVFVVASLLALAGCASAPLKQDTKLAPYNTAIVKDLFIEDGSLVRIEGDELTEFFQAKPELIKLYTDNLKTHLAKTNLFDKISGETISGKAIIVESKTSLVDPGIRMVMPSSAIVTVMVSDAETGRKIGTYTVTRHSGRQVWTTMMGAIKKDVTDMGEDASNDLADKLRN